MATIPTLDTPRLRLRPFTAGDAPEVQRLAGARAVADTTLHIPHPYPDGAAEAWIATHAPAFDAGRSITFAITERTDGALRGAIGLTDIRSGHQAGLGYWIGEPYWNQGLCTEAARAVIDFGVSTYGLVRVHACHLSRNPASGRVMQKLGMVHEGRRHQHVRRWGAPEDLELYGVVFHA